MMKYLVLVIAISVSACSTPPPIIAEKSQLPNGSWKGKIHQITTKQLPDSSADDTYDVVVQTCNGSTEFWLSSDHKKYVKPYNDFKQESVSGNLLYSVMKDGGNWVETQTWTIVLINEKNAAIQWNRMVGNPKLGDDEELRSFGQLGYGTLRKIRDTCDLIKSKN